MFFAAAAAAAVIAGRSQEPAQAAALWTGGGSDVNYPTAGWNDANNWEALIVPAAGDDVTFAKGFKSGYQIDLAGPRVVRRLLLDTKDDFSLTGVGSSLLITNAINRGSSAVGQHVIDVPVTLDSDQTWTIGGAGGALNLNRVVNTSNPGDGLTLSGGGNLTLAGAGSALAHLDVAAVTLAQTAGSIALTSSSIAADHTAPLAIGASTMTINAGATTTVTGATALYDPAARLNVSGGTLTSGLLHGVGGSAIALTDTAGVPALQINGGAGTGTYAGQFTGAGTLLKTGGSTQILTGTGSTLYALQTYGGGTLTLDGASVTTTSTAFYSTWVDSGARLNIVNGAHLTGMNGAPIIETGAIATVDGAGSSWTGSGQFTLAAGSTAEMDVQNGGHFEANLIFQGFYNGSDGRLFIRDGGTVTTNTAVLGVQAGSKGSTALMGAGTLWNTQTLSFGGNDATHQGAGAISVVSGAAVEVSGTTTIWTAPPAASSENIFVNGGRFSTGLLKSDGAVGAIRMLSDPAGGAALTINSNDPAASETYAGTITSESTATLLKTGASTQVLGAANPGHTGRTQIDGGQIKLANANALQNSAVVLNVNNGLNLNALPSATIASLAGSGNLALGATILTAGANNAATSYSGMMTSGAGGKFVKVGSGTMTLTGGFNLPGGRFWVDGGNVILNGGAYSATTGGFDNVRVSNGATLTFQNGAQYAASDGGPTVNGGGVMTITGAGTKWNSSPQVEIGSVSVGTLNVQNSATFQTPTLNLAQTATGRGTVNVTAGGIVSVSGLNIAFRSGSTGTVNISGAGSSLAAANLYIGGDAGTHQGTGSVNVSNGAALSVTAQTTIWTPPAAGMANLVVNGGAFVTPLLRSDGGVGLIYLAVDMPGHPGMLINSNTAASSQTYSGIIGGFGSVSKSGASSQTFSGANTYSGGTTITGGRLISGATNALGSGPITMGSPGRLELNGFDQTTPSLSGTGGTVDLGATGSNTLTIEGFGNSTFAGQITGANSGGVRETGGAWTMSGAGSNFHHLAVAGGNVSIDGGSVTLTSLGGLGNPTAPLRIGAAGTNAALGVVNGGTLVSGNPTGSSSVLVAGGSGPGVASVMFVSGAGSTWQLAYQNDFGGSAGAGQLIVQNGGAVRGPSSAADDQTALFLGNAPTGSDGHGTLMVQNAGTVSDFRGAIAVNVASSATVSGPGSIWNNKAQLDLGGFVGFGAGAGAGTLNIESGGVVTSGGDTHLWNAASFINISGGSLVTSGLAGVGSIILNGDGGPGEAALTVGGRDSIYNGVISGPATLRKINNTALVLTSNTNVGAARVEGGILEMSANLTTTWVSAANDGILSMSSGGARLLKTTLVDMTGTGTIDLHDNKMIVLSGDVGAANPFTGVYSGLSKLIQSARGESGDWTGRGITTSMPAAQAGLTTVAIATGEQVRGIAPGETGTFAGETIDGSNAILMYTYAGDANLDGLIDGGDYGIIDNFAQVWGASGYANGDFNYDGVIDGGDYGIIDNNVQAQGAPFPTSASIEASGLSGVTAVPEPVCGFAILTMLGFFGGRRRRRNRGYSTVA